MELSHKVTSFKRPEGRPLSRGEAKEVTRRRLIEAALAILNEEGEAGLSASAVSRRAGIAQSSFYVHFRDKRDLLGALGEELSVPLRRALRDARRRAREAPNSEERLREIFRVPLEMIAANPALFRLSLRSRHEPASPLGDSSRELSSQHRREIVDDLALAGFATDTAADRRRVEMLARGYIALTEALALGHIDGRFPDIEEIVDVLTLFARGPRALLADERRRSRPPDIAAGGRSAD